MLITPTAAVRYVTEARNKASDPITRHNADKTLALFFRVIDSLNVFDTIYGTTTGGPGDTTRVLSINGYENAFPFYSLSIGLTVFMMLWVLCMVTGYLLYRRVKQTQAA